MNLNSFSPLKNLTLRPNVIIIRSIIITIIIMFLTSSDETSESASRSTIATRYRPDYGHNRRNFLGPGYFGDRPYNHWMTSLGEANVETFHRPRTYGREWSFTDYDEEEESSEFTSDDTSRYYYRDQG